MTNSRSFIYLGWYFSPTVKEITLVGCYSNHQVMSIMDKHWFALLLDQLPCHFHRTGNVVQDLEVFMDIGAVRLSTPAPIKSQH